MSSEGATPRPAVRVIAFNSGWQLVTFLARAASGLAAVILVARTGGPRELGIYQFALTLSLMFSFLVGFGLPNFLTREVARQPDEGRSWTESGIFVTIVSGGVLTAILALATRWVGASPVQADAIVLAGAALIFDTAGRIEFALFWAWERMGLESLATCLQEGAFVLGTVLALGGGAGVRGVMVAYLASRALGSATGWVIASRGLGGPVVPRPNVTFLRPILRRAIPFAADDALSLTYIRVDTVLLGFMKGATAVGFYQAGTNLVLYLNVLARMLNYPLFPRMSRAWLDNRGSFGRLRDASLRLLGAMGVPIMVGSLLLAPRIFEFVYGPRFDRAVLCYQILVLVIPIRMLGHTLGTALTAANGQTQRTIAVAMAAAANVLLNLWFIPWLSFTGAAVTTGITESGLFLAYAFVLRRAAGRSQVAAALGVPALGCVPMAIVVLVLFHAPLFVTATMGAAVYGLSMFAITLALAPEGTPRTPRAAVSAFVKAAT